MILLCTVGGSDNTYSDNLFTIELHHGEFFVGSGQLRTYVDEKIDWFDYCDANILSPRWCEDFLYILGYSDSDTDSLKVYWLLPGKDLSDGLRLIKDHADNEAMRSVVGRVQTMVVYIDHEGTLGGVNWDDLVVNPVAEKKEPEPLPDFYKNLRSSVDEQKSEPVTNDNCSDDDSEDSDFVDSDNEVERGDDDLFVDYVDDDVVDEGVGKGKRIGRRSTAVTYEEGDHESSDDEGLQVADDDVEGQINLKFKNFRTEDMSNPSFKVGMVFESVEILRKAITKYSLKNKVDIKMPKNDQRRIRAHCAVGCPWTLYASKNSRVKAL